MKPQFSSFARFCLGLTFLAAVAAQGATAPATTPAAGTNSLALQEPPKSVFIIPLTIKEGRNPFFPGSTQALPSPDPGQKRVVQDVTFVLNGITSPPKRTAMINGRTFEVGESGEVKLATGAKVLIKCEEIGNDSVTITYEGQRRELRLRIGV